jgi:hypothetical protein
VVRWALVRGLINEQSQEAARLTVEHKSIWMRQLQLPRVCYGGTTPDCSP